MLGRFDHVAKAKDIELALNEKFWIGTHFRDYLGTGAWDTLGNALAVISGVAAGKQVERIFEKAEEFDSPYGYKLNTTTLPPKNSKEFELMQRVNQIGVIWPFIHGYMILAAQKAGKNYLAKVQFEKWNALPGFFEWYDPETGEGYGSTDQLWSAALYLRCADAIGKIS